MRHGSPSRLRYMAAATVVAMAPLSFNLFPTPDVLMPKAKSVTLEYALTAAIEESGTTVGIADSNIWGLSRPDGSIDKAAMDAHLDAMQALGVNTVRVVIPWRGNEPFGPPGTLPSESWEQSYWERSDYIISQAAERGMGVLGVLNHAPTWGDTNPNTPIPIPGMEEPPDPVKFAEYVKRVVARYGPMVSAYEVWNEPNAAASWAPAIDPVAYTQVLKLAYDAIKGPNGPDANDPMVVAGVLGAVVTFGGLTLDPRDFVDSMYENGAKGFFDALSFHPYHYSLKFSEGKWNWFEPWKANSPLQQVIDIRKTMLEYLDKEVRIWATEYGLPTSGLNAVTEEKQRAFIEDFLKSWAKLADADGTSYVGPAFLYTLRDSFLNGELTEATSLGLFKYDALTGQWVMKEAAEWLQDFLDGVDPGDPGEQPAPPQNIVQVLQALMRSVQAVFRSFTDSFNAMVTSFQKMLASLFPPARAAVTTLAATEEESAEAATITVATDVDEGSTDATDSAADTEAVDADAAEESVDEEPVAEEPVEEEPVEEVPVDESVEVEPVEESVEADDESLVRDSFVAKPGQLGDAGADDSADADGPADDTDVTEVGQVADPADSNVDTDDTAGDSSSSDTDSSDSSDSQAA